MLQNRLCILPITNGGALNVGAEWYVKLPVAPTMSGKFSMPVSVVHRVTAVKEVRGRRCAAIEYHLQLRLSPLEQPDMFQDFLAGPFFFDYKLEGGGTAWVDLEEGIVVEKTQEFTMTKFAKLRRAPGDGEDAWQVRENVESRTRWKVTLDSARD